MQLAQVNVSRLKAPLDSAQLRDFVAALDPVNATAEASDGFVWRLQSDQQNATDIAVLDDEWMLINLTVWRDLESLRAFMYAGLHREVMRRRNEWFERLRDATTALWWVPDGHEPSVAEAEERLHQLRAHGPTGHVFTLRHNFPAPVAS